MDSNELQSYKQSKREFRKQQRRRIYELQNKNMLEFSQHQDLDSRYFWYLVNKQRKRTSCTPIRSENGVMLSDLDSIKSEWTNYYDNLYSERESGKYDDEFKTKIETEVEHFGNSVMNEEYLKGGTYYDSGNFGNSVKIEK